MSGFCLFRPVEPVPHVMTAGDLHVVTVRRGLGGRRCAEQLYSILAAGGPCWRLRPRRATRRGLSSNPDAVSRRIRMIPQAC